MQNKLHLLHRFNYYHYYYYINCHLIMLVHIYKLKSDKSFGYIHNLLSALKLVVI